MTQSDAGCDNRLADEAMYFGAVADGVESQQEEIAELRQQLANALAANEHNLRVYHAAAAELRQQLSERDAEVKLLRDAIRFFMKAEGDPHGECAEEIANLQNLLGLCYAKLLKFGVENSDPLLMDELKLELTK